MGSNEMQRICEFRWWMIFSNFKSQIPCSPFPIMTSIITKKKEMRFKSVKRTLSTSQTFILVLFLLSFAAVQQNIFKWKILKRLAWFNPVNWILFNFKKWILFESASDQKIDSNDKILATRSFHCLEAKRWNLSNQKLGCDSRDSIHRIGFESLSNILSSLFLIQLHKCYSNQVNFIRFKEIQAI